jgi:hypothetical protein
MIKPARHLLHTIVEVIRDLVWLARIVSLLGRGASMP